MRGGRPPVEEGRRRGRDVQGDDGARGGACVSALLPRSGTHPHVGARGRRSVPPVREVSGECNAEETQPHRSEGREDGDGCSAGRAGGVASAQCRGRPCRLRLFVQLRQLHDSDEREQVRGVHPRTQERARRGRGTQEGLRLGLPCGPAHQHWRPTRGTHYTPLSRRRTFSTGC
ncbi:MAG: hypothetical protein AMK75_07395 [Planctomycetes bacterium SM23_65]|nr:MAG: hypothetical protein AMK75_07395 [Planctomycetes bacterium SM23_65]